MALPLHDEPSIEMGATRRDALVDGAGRRYAAIRPALRPRHVVVWAQLLSGHAALALVAIASWRIETTSPWLAGILAPLHAFAFGYVFHYIQLFLHEAAHYNLAPGRRRNDFLANLCVGILSGQDVRRYRPVHFDHHRFLGTVRDTEPSYFEALDWRFVLESLAGVHTLRILLGRRRSFQTGTGGEEAPGGGYYTAMLPLGIAANGTVVLGAALADHPWFAAAWAAGALAVLPFLAAVRQILEHRSVAADPRADYRRVDHGVVNRMFGSGPIASTLGGAGFNRHLLHHWDPQVPCTRLAELERYLRGTAFAEVIRSAETTYLRTLRELFRRA